jgi:uncharacterized OB-fold protein
MSLVTCPDCGNSVSTDAVACPQCGRPLAPVVVEPIPAPEVIVREVPREKKFPPWAIALIAILGAGVLLTLFMLMRNRDADEDNRNINVRMSQRDAATNSRSSTNATTRSGTTTTVPQTSEVTVPSSQDTTVVTTNTPLPRTETATGETVPVNKSVLTIDAKIRSSSGTAQPVQKETFYLLDKDLESILSEANIDDEEGRGLVNAFGMSVVYPSRYPEINRKALAAINKHVVAKTLTDGSGKAKFPDVKPNSYYLFGITKTREGFSVWNTPITLSEGQMNLNLEPSGSGR